MGAGNEHVVKQEKNDYNELVIVLFFRCVS
jgi:hypothetical protein